MKILIMGPRQFADRVRDILVSENPDVEFSLFRYSRYTETIEFLKNNQHKFDCVLFPGHVSYMYAETLLEKTALWEYIPLNMGSLYRALLELSAKNYNLHRISIDTYTEEMIKGAYQEVGIESEEAKLYFAVQKSEDPGYYDYLLKFHQDNFYSRRVDCCISGVTEVYEALCRMHIPCVRTIPIAHVVLNTYQKLYRKYTEKNLEGNHIVVMAIHLDLPSYYSLQENNEYSHLMCRVEVAKQIHIFASRLSAAVVENTDRDFLLFANKSSIELETGNFDELYLSELFHDIAYHNISIGIGYGRTAKSAKYHAYSGIGKAMKNGNSVAYVVYSDRRVRGPIRIKMTKKEVGGFDQKLEAVSKMSGIGTASLFRLYEVVLSSAYNEFTTKELAAACGMSKRNMDRIIERLVDSNYCRIVGERTGAGGRPARIIEFTAVW